MNRNKLIEAMEARYRMFSTAQQVMVLGEVLSKINDADLVVIAQDMGIDTDILFTEMAK